MKGCTVQVSNISCKATLRDLHNLFSLISGEIDSIDLRREGEWSQVAYVTFKHPDAMDNAVLRSGATIFDQPVSITCLEDQDQEIAWEHQALHLPVHDHVSLKAQDMVNSILGKQVVNKAKAFDDGNQNIVAYGSPKKTNLSQTWNSCVSIAKSSLNSVNDKFQIGESTISAFIKAQRGFVNAGSALMNNRYVMAGGSWASFAFHKAVGAVSLRGQDSVNSPRQSMEA